MRNLLTLWVAPGLACAMLMACTGDDSNGAKPMTDASFDDVETPGLDAGSGDAQTPGKDATSQPSDAHEGGGGDGGQCNFATFVKGLIAKDTTASALPSTDLGQNCKDNQDQAEYKSLFP